MSKNVVSVRGGKVHTMMTGMDEHPYPLCRGGGMNNALTKFTTTDAPLSCKTCLTYEERRNERLAAEAAETVADTQSDEPKEDDMPAKNDSPSDATNMDVDTLISDVHATVDQIKALVPGSEGVTSTADALKSEAEGKIRQLPTNKRTALRKSVAEAHKAATAKPAEPEPAPAASTAIVRQAENPLEIEGIPALVSQAKKAFKDGIKYGLKLAEVGETVARTQLEMRLKMVHTASGLPDLMSIEKKTKNAAGLVYDGAREGVAKDDTKTNDAHDALQKATQNKMADILVGWLRDFGSSPNPDEALETAKALFPGVEEFIGEDGNLTDAIYALYKSKEIELPRYGRTEIQRFNYRVKQLDSARGELDAARDALDEDGVAKEEKEKLTAKVRELEEKAKGITDELPAEWTEKAAPEKTPKERATEKVERAKKLTASVTKAVKKLEGAERQEVSTSLVAMGRELITNATAGADKLTDDEKADLKSQLESLVTVLAGEAAKL